MRSQCMLSGCSLGCGCRNRSGEPDSHEFEEELIAARGCPRPPSLLEQGDVSVPTGTRRAPSRGLPGPAQAGRREAGRCTRGRLSVPDLDEVLHVLYITYMPRASATVADLRSHLSRILRRVEGGDEVVVTRHGEGIAKLVPVLDPGEKLAASGVRPAERSGPIPKVRPIAGRVRRSLTRAVLEDRA